MSLFFGDKTGTSFEGLALTVSIIAVGFVASADILDYMTKPGSPTVAVASATNANGTNGDLDYAPTASLPKLVARSVLDPCTGAVK